MYQPRRGSLPTPVSKRQDKPDGIAWLLRNHPEISDAQISKLIGTTRNTITAIRERSHWNIQNIQPKDPVTLGLQVTPPSGTPITMPLDGSTLVAQGWRHTGYIMLMYLAGLKGVDVSLREAALMDGCTEWQTFFKVVFPVMKPINIIVLVITVIQSLRAFDLVWVINKGRNGLELIAALVTQNVSGEASRIGFASALATIMLLISTVFVIVYLRVVMRDEPGGAR